MDYVNEKAFYKSVATVTLGAFLVSTAARVDRKIKGLMKFEL
jgi:hypothetical protein